MIPKIIHSIWLGPNKKPDNFSDVFSSWKTYATDFEIREWTEESAREFDLPEYYHRALKEKKWAFASDVLRFYILERYGGFYFDIDQVLIRSIGDFLPNDFIISMYHERKDYFGFGLIGCSPHNRISNNFVHYFKTYYAKDSARVFEIVNVFGSEIILNQYHKNKTGIRLLTQDYFYPLKLEDHTENTHSYHLSNTSWVPTYKKVLQRIPFYGYIKKITTYILPKSVLKKMGFNIKYF